MILSWMMQDVSYPAVTRDFREHLVIINSVVSDLGHGIMTCWSFESFIYYSPDEASEQHI